MAADQTLEWQQARQWLINSGVIPVTNKVTKPGVDLVDFVRSLRDGVFLCSLLNKLKPDCVPENDFNHKPLMQHSYLKNISTFLHICETKFRLKESDLFNAPDLYDVDNFRVVVQLLSKLSHTPEALQLGWVPFPRQESRNYYNEPSAGSRFDEEDIYASLKEIGIERLYANVGDYVPPEEEEDPYSYGDDAIYDSICYYQAPPVKTTDSDEKKGYVMKELYETERSFLTVLSLISQEFFTALCELICAEDVELIFSTAKELYPIHCALLEGFERCLEPGGDITKCFLDAQKGLLQYGIYAARLPKAVERAKALQTRRETGQVLQACQDRSRQRFPLKDLLNVPIQRFLKYPLLIKELHKCAKKASMPSQSEITNLEKVQDLLEDIARYINATKGDYEGMKQIEEVEQSLEQYKGPSLTTCGNYHLDGELRIKTADGNSKTPRWVFLFDKVMLICQKKSRLRLSFEVRYSVKHTFPVGSLRVEPITNPSGRGGNFSQGFKLIVKGQGDFLAYAKTEELKSQWIDAINHAREMSSPRDGKKGHHKFELYTFDKPHYCDACHKLLHGCYFQGYFCPDCQRAAHRDCLTVVVSCSTPPGHPQMPATHRRLHTTRSTPGLDRPAGHPTPHPRGSASVLPTNGVDSKRGQIYVARQRYDAIGSRSNRVLSFDRGEELEVMNPVAGADWWDALSLKTGNRGEVPASYLVPKGVSVDLDDSPIGNHSRGGAEREIMSQYAWYIGRKSRIEAEQALHKMKDGVFVIRESDVRDGEYAIALKWNRMPKHIKICKHTATRKYFVADVCEFNSVADLVGYYRTHSLGSSFPGVDTPLQYPLKEERGAESGGTRRNRSISNPPPPQLPPQPPSPVLPPGGDRWADVLFNFPAEYPDELTIDKHDRVKILEKDTNMLGWWLGECNGRRGLFPSNYVREITS